MKFKNNKLIIILTIISVILTGFVYNMLPDKVPSHWNMYGEIDDYKDKGFVWFTAFLPIFMILMMNVLPKIDPKKESYKKHQKAYNKVIGLLSVFFILIHWITILFSLGYEINIPMIMSISIGVLFVVVGNYMGQIRHNYFFGIKTPWTLANEVVWKKTHRVGGIGFILSGIVFIVFGFINKSYGFWVSIIFIIGVTLYTFLYSYLEFKKIQR